LTTIIIMEPAAAEVSKPEMQPCPS